MVVEIIVWWKLDIDVMMLFKFDIKYVKLNFKAIVSMEFNFDIKFYLLCSYGGCLFIKKKKKNRWKLSTSALCWNYGLMKIDIDVMCLIWSYLLG